MSVSNNFDGFLYHITRYEKLDLGQKLQFGGKPNRFALNFSKLEFMVGDKDVNQLVIEKDLKDFNDAEKNILKSYIYESCLISRELILENVRQKNFPNLPSRLECIYCVKSLIDAKKWVQILKRMDRKNPPLQIVKLKASGNLFCGDGSLITRNTKSINSKIEMANNYWSKSTTSENVELLFVGAVEVVEIVEDI